MINLKSSFNKMPLVTTLLKRHQLLASLSRINTVYSMSTSSGFLAGIKQISQNQGVESMNITNITNNNQGSTKLRSQSQKNIINLAKQINFEAFDLQDAEISVINEILNQSNLKTIYFEFKIDAYEKIKLLSQRKQQDILRIIFIFTKDLTLPNLRKISSMLNSENWIFENIWDCICYKSLFQLKSSNLQFYLDKANIFEKRVWLGFSEENKNGQFYEVLKERNQEKTPQLADFISSILLHHAFKFPKRIIQNKSSIQPLLQNMLQQQISNVILMKILLITRLILENFLQKQTNVELEICIESQWLAEIAKITSQKLNLSMPDSLEQSNSQIIEKFQSSSGDEIEKVLKKISLEKKPSISFIGKFINILLEKYEVLSPSNKLHIARSLVRMGGGRRFVQKFLEDLSQGQLILNINDQILVLFMMAHSNIVYRSLIEKYQYGLTTYIDSSSSVDDIVFLLYSLAKCGFEDKTITKRIHAQIEKLGIDSINKSKIAPYTWALILTNSPESLSSHFFSKIEDNITNFDRGAYFQLAECIASLRIKGEPIYEALSLKTLESKLQMQLEKFGFNRNKTYTEAQRKFINIITQKFGTVELNMWWNGFYFDLVIPKLNIYLDILDKFSKTQDTFELIGSLKSKTKIFKENELLKIKYFAVQPTEMDKIILNPNEIDAFFSIDK